MGGGKVSTRQPKTGGICRRLMRLSLESCSWASVCNTISAQNKSSDSRDFNANSFL